MVGKYDYTVVLRDEWIREVGTLIGTVKRSVTKGYRLFDDSDGLRHNSKLEGKDSKLNRKCTDGGNGIFVLE